MRDVPAPDTPSAANTPMSYKRRCMTATSSQRLNLRPTWRSMPTSWNPHLLCKARDADPAGLDPGHHGVKPGFPGDVDEPAEEHRADSLTTRPAVDVDRVLDGRRVGGAILVRRQRREPGDGRPGMIFVDGDDRGEGSRASSQPLLLVGQRSGDEVERARRGRHLVVVDRSDSFGVVDGGGAQADPRHAGRG